MTVIRRLVLIAFLIILIGPAFTQPALANCTIQGQAYRDYNANGIDDGLLEPGVAGILVTAYTPAGTAAGSATTGPDGSYVINITIDSPLRIEFTGLPTHLRAGPTGAGQDTTVIFVDSCTGGQLIDDVSTGVANIADYCHDEPLLATSCFVQGDQINGTQADMDVLVSFPYSSGTIGSANPADYDGPIFDEAVARQMGSVWGVAYQRTSDTLYTTPLIRRHAGLGPGGTGAIYAITNISNDVFNPAAVTEFINLDDYFGVNTAGADPRDATTDYVTDAGAYNAVGRIGWGDLDISEDDTRLFAINLFDRNLYVIPIGRPPTPPASAAQITRRLVPTPPGCPASDVRPFATKYQDGLVYVGLICSAETSQNRDLLRAYVYPFNPISATFGAPVLAFDLDYPRTCLNGAPAPCLGYTTTGVPFDPQGDGDWLPWLTPAQPFPFVGSSFSDVAYPQPILADIEFDGPDMILSLTDRWGYMQADREGRTPNWPTSTELYNARSGGDILRACPVAGGWALEANGACGGFAGGGNPGQGPGGDEFYTGDTFVVSHDETVVGGLAQVPGYANVAVAVYDPIPIASELYDGGIRWLRNRVNDGGINPGEVARAFRLFDEPGGTPVSAFGKGNGLGDMEGLCGPAPLEIGNRIWEDLDRNGVQDPGEIVLPGVVVSLFDAGGVLIAQTTTDANGEYYFNEGTVFDPADPRTWLDINGDGIRNNNEPAGILANTTYTVSLDDPANYGGGPLTPYYASPNNTTARLRDSDGIVADFTQLVSLTNVPAVTLTTGFYGENDHTFDFGFSRLPRPLPAPPRPGETPPAIAQAGGGPGIISKVVNPPFAQPGDSVDWIITVTNPGSNELRPALVTDNLPAGVEIIRVSASSGSATFSGQTVTFTQDVLGAGASVTITVSTRVRSDVAVPFIMNNNATLDGCCSAQATLISAGQLPATGELPVVRALLIAIALGLLGAVGFLIAQRWRTQPE